MDRSRAPLTTITRLPTAAGSRGILIYNSSRGAEKADTNRNPTETKTSNIWKEGRKKETAQWEVHKATEDPQKLSFLLFRRWTMMLDCHKKTCRVVTKELVLIKKQQCKYVFSVYIQVITDWAVAGSAQREPQQISTQKGPWTPEECSLEPSICKTRGGGVGQGHHCDTRSIYGKMLMKKMFFPSDQVPGITWQLSPSYLNKNNLQAHYGVKRQ